MIDNIRAATINAETKDAREVMFIAKHALWAGGLHPDDGNHAIYHVEIRNILCDIGMRVKLADSHDALFDSPNVDFVFALLNRAGFLNSEMLLPLLCTRLGLPFLGASPILRGLGDDKHLTKLEARARGVPTAPWAIYRRGAPVLQHGCPMAERMVIKPNASSASWGVSDAGDWAGVKAAVERLHDEGHDAIVEPFLNGSDVEVPVITQQGAPAIMPMMLFEQADPTHLRTYWEKRDLVDRSAKYSLVAFDDPHWMPVIADYTRRMAGVFAPFDYARFEFRLDQEKGEVMFLENNLNCNLWSQKVFGRSATLAGLSHHELIETILAESFARQGLLVRERELAA